MFLNQFKQCSKIYSAYLLVIVIAFSSVFSFAKQPNQNNCSGLYLLSPMGKFQFSNPNSPKTSPRIRTENLLNYLSLVFNQQQVSLEALTNMLRSLEQGQLINPVSEKEALNSSIIKVIRNGIQSSISRGDLDVERLLQGLREIVNEETRQEERRGEAHEKTTVPVYRPKFHNIRPGEFMMGENSEKTKQVETEITIPFAMMDTQFTQYIWARLTIAMGERTDLQKINPSKFKKGPDSIKMNIDGIDIQMKPNHPVENVSWNDVKEFIDGLNQLSSQGDSKVQGLLEELIPGHQNGDIYDFPTEAQWEFVMRDRGNANKLHFDRDDETEVPKYAWFKRNSGVQTHAVATRLARMIDGKPFYDLEGNVCEWVRDRYGAKLPGGTDPQGSAQGSDRVIRGGSWDIYERYLRSGYRHSFPPGYRGDILGFRLVRTRP